MKEQQFQTGFWDRLAQEKEFKHPLSIEILAKYIPRSGKILDLGCGYGRVLSVLFNSGYKRLIGLDPSPKMIERGLKENPQLDLRVLKQKELLFEDGSFDAVIVFAVLTCIPGDKDQEETVAEIYRVLRPGGIVYISDYFIQQDNRNRKRYEHFAAKYGRYGVFELDEGALLRHLEPERFEKLISAFQRLEQYDFNIETMNSNPARAFQYIGRKAG